MGNRQIILYFILFIVLGFSGWLYVRIDANEQQQANIPHHQPNSFAYQVKVTTFDQHGKMNRRMTTPKLLHYPDDNSTLFEQPHIILYRSNQMPWTVNAHYAKAEQDGKRITFWEKVCIQQPKGVKYSHDDSLQNSTKLSSCEYLTPLGTLISTSRLVYFPDQHFASTTKPITLIQPGVKIDSLGLKAYLDREEFILPSHVRGDYETTS